MPRSSPPSGSRLFLTLRGTSDIHSSSVGRRATALASEADFIVLVPGRDMLVSEVKAPSFVEYEDLSAALSAWIDESADVALASPVESSFDHEDVGVHGVTVPVRSDLDRRTDCASKRLDRGAECRPHIVSIARPIGEDDPHSNLPAAVHQRSRTVQCHAHKARRVRTQLWWKPVRTNSFMPLT
ncbi:hypothetical protein [uncultured Microbacterium sp.]|uniref:hypothetical protein n=1 Tax=uncultured Microbacterium sp. TaxID=191216 RepID=UPI0025E371E3|nr:hypothetical protein [uncultured Microbacterium sp.]